MAFDPDEFLEKNRPFDPDKFLGTAQPEVQAQAPAPKASLKERLAEHVVSNMRETSFGCGRSCCNPAARSWPQQHEPNRNPARCAGGYDVLPAHAIGGI